MDVGIRFFSLWSNNKLNYSSLTFVTEIIWNFTGQTWFHHRKVITPAFHVGVLDGYVTVMQEKAQIFTECIEKLLEKSKDEPINIMKLAARYSLDTICETAMGINFDSQKNANISYLSAVHE